MTDSHVAYPCPYCSVRNMEAAAKLPYVRGYVLAFRFGSKKIIGCRRCVRLQLLRETGVSCAIGWFSPTAIVSNPFLVVYGLALAAVVRGNADAVRRELAEVGVREPDAEPELVRIAYSLAASMITADHRIEPEELETAAEIGRQLFADFDTAAFHSVVANHRKLPEPAELAAVLSGVLDDEGKDLMYGFLLAIASADDELAQAERDLLEVVARNMKLHPDR